MKKLTNLLIAILLGTASTFGLHLPNYADSLTGIWLGKIKATEQLEMRIAFEISRNETGLLSAKMNVIEQKAFNIPMEAVIMQNDTLQILFTAGRIDYKGIYQADTKTIDGLFTQSGKSFPLVLSPVKELPLTVNRPQTPQRPLPYHEEEVVFENKSASVQLAGTLTMPKSTQAKPAIILIAGSGRNDRNGTKMGHFFLLSDYLTRQGYIVLRSDKRGVGKSTGDYRSSTTADFASDIHAAIDYLKTRPEVDSRQIGLIGHSEGAVIAPMVASARKDISYLILMGGVGMQGDELLLLQTRKLSEANGATPDAIEEQINSFRSWYAIIGENIPDSTKISRIREVDPTVSEGAIKLLMTPWIAYFTSCNASDYLKKVKCPVLAITGSKDLQCPPEENFKEIESALKSARNKDFTLQVMPGLNHLFQTAQSGSPMEYEKIEEIIAPQALSYISDWISTR